VQATNFEAPVAVYPSTKPTLPLDAKGVQYWIPVFGFAVLIFCLSAIPKPEVYLPVLAWLGSDKAAHAIEYGMLAILCYRAFRNAGGYWAARNAFMLAMFASAGYGLTDEWHQYFVPFRSADGFDLLADSLGCLSALLAWRHIVE
jgi:VanZ family protein